jgi:hypothetical protein
MGWEMTAPAASLHSLLCHPQTISQRKPSLKHPWGILRDLLCSTSQYFKEKLQKSCQVVEGDCSICTDDVLPRCCHDNHFGRYVPWLYFGTVPAALYVEDD